MSEKYSHILLIFTVLSMSLLNTLTFAICIFKYFCLGRNWAINRIHYQVKPVGSIIRKVLKYYIRNAGEKVHPGRWWCSCCLSVINFLMLWIPPSPCWWWVYCSPREAKHAINLPMMESDCSACNQETSSGWSYRFFQRLLEGLPVVLKALHTSSFILAGV